MNSTQQKRSKQDVRSIIRAELDLRCLTHDPATGEIGALLGIGGGERIVRMKPNAVLSFAAFQAACLAEGILLRCEQVETRQRPGESAANWRAIVDNAIEEGRA